MSHNYPQTPPELLDRLAQKGCYDLYQVKLLIDHGGRENGPYAPGDPQFITWLWQEIMADDLCLTDFQYAWISPKGAVWSVSYAAHATLANIVFGIGERALELAGWLRVSDYATHVLPLTRAQLDAHAEHFPEVDFHDISNLRNDPRVPIKTPFDYNPKRVGRKPLPKTVDPYQVPETQPIFHHQV
jgi:hypothetical protein